MEYAIRMRNLKSSAIRQMLKMTADREIISFAGGLPDDRLFPTEAIAHLTQRIIKDHGRVVLQYAPTEGLPSLRGKIAGFLRRKGIEVGPDHVLITQGSQQGIDLLSKLFVDPGTKLLTENPSYLGAVQSFRFFEANLRSVAVDEEGMIPSDLWEVLQEKPRLCYLMPNFQNPTGLLYTRKRREEVSEALSGHKVALVEDDPYGELIYEGSPLPSLWGFYPASSKVHLGTFSKTIVPGLRVAYLVSEPDIIHRLAQIKQATDLHTNGLGQWIVDAYLEEGLWESHIEAIRCCYRQKRDIMAAAIQRYFPSFVKWEPPKGGMFFWVQVPGNLHLLGLLNACLARGVAFVLGDDFFIEPPSEVRYLRLNFTSVAEGKIEPGIATIGEEMVRIAAREEAASILR